MGIPRHVPITGKNSDPLDKDIFNPFINDDDDEPEAIVQHPVGVSADQLMGDDDAFENDSLPPAPEVIGSDTIKNLDDNDLDDLLGIGETNRHVGTEPPLSVPTMPSDGLPDLEVPESKADLSEPLTEPSGDIEETLPEDDDDFIDIDGMISSIEDGQEPEGSEEDEDGGFGFEDEGNENPTDADGLEPVSIEDPDDKESTDVDDWGFEDSDPDAEEHDDDEAFSLTDDETDDVPENMEDDSSDGEANPNGEKQEPQNEERPRTPSFIDGLKKRFSNILEQVKADAKGGEAPVVVKDDEESEQDSDPTEDDGKAEDKQEDRRRGGESGKRSSILKKIYSGVISFFFSIVMFVLGLLSHIPFIGRFIKPIMAATKVLRAVAMALPIVFLVGTCVLASFLSVPRSTTIELPDEGSATFSNFSYSDGIVKGTVKNTGNIIIETNADFTVYSIQPSLNPISWFIPKEVSKCSSDVVSVDIDDSANITAKCDNVSGFIPRASGELNG